jgi:peroxiredoxin
MKDGSTGPLDEAPDGERTAESVAKPRWQRILETGFWIGLIIVLGWRFAPQLGALLGLDGGDAGEAPAIQVQTLEGREIALADLRGQVVLVNFWATWCGPCRIEMPGFQRVYEAYRDRGFTIVGLSTDIGSPDLVRAFVARHELTFPIASAGPATQRAFGGIPALPMSFLIDRDGRIRHAVRGIFPSLALEQAVKRLLDEGTQPARGSP